ncbi:MAG: UvrD-helicase domain-containing protein [Lentimicrobiaceae bacterium]|nr:UvrD-helicase domain-containing protein [Lentimicrobiaceae bacterium]MBT3454139.1 UvrD-helicase domain-containing protein [Lentimicrobiaceae bacterium]MBT3819327.1 UvrD-helicase domain-containing protein [Lentimicrobiaceae bacterium]MBT4061000.1 UvrD-helicase domain-containing protein [Lentimicrobiaceae bacterium]MBT4189918.1 UvrD-helicase domain-containing protein [Lentimicrobiaceae bacterium]
MSDFLKQLNKDQLRAVTQINGPTMVIAGAGSGKTRVLTYRIAYLLSKGIDPFNILALTFTNKAAREMKERVINLIGDGDARNVWMGTFHSIFAKILRIEGHYLGYPSNYTIYDSNDSKRLIKNIISDMKLDTKQYSPSYVSSRISMAKSSLISTDEYANDSDIQSADESARKPYIKEIYSRYQSRLKRADAMDFDDLLFNTYILFSRFPKVLYKYQQKFKYTLVDEYQDTNHAQYLIVKKLAANTEQICVVGDDAQSIYGFRGANISNILNFKSDYPDFKMFKLEQNYRSTKTIVEAANQVITFNKEQIKKTVWTDNNTGNKIGYFKAQSDTEEGKMIADSIFEKKMNEQLSNDKFTILYRTNAQSRSIEEALRKKNIPYRIYSGQSFYTRKEIKDLLAYFRLVINNNDEDALQRIINTPARGIGKTTIEKIIVAADINNVNIWEVINNPAQYDLKVNSGIVLKLNNFSTMINSFCVVNKSKDAYETANHIAVSSGLLKMFREEDTPEAISRVENIEELLNGIKEFTEKAIEKSEGDMSVHKTLDEFMEDVALLTDADSDDDEDRDKVMMMTIHASKGLEFPHVYIVGLEENLFPSIQSITTRTELEEERRLFYVALTRAMETVTLSHAETRYRWGNFTITEPSRFLDEIEEGLIDKPKESLNLSNRESNFSKTQSDTGQHSFKKRNLMPLSNSGAEPTEDSDISELKSGADVEHAKFGRGKIISIEGSGPNMKATVFFNSVGNKNLLLRFAKLKIV